MAALGSKKNREIYVGNLLPGVVTAEMMKTLFDSAIRAAYPTASPGSAPVVAVNMSADLK
jgi:splicing factor U2AF subunit